MECADAHGCLSMNNIKLMNKLECDECKIKWKKTVPLTFIYDKMFCGDCAIKILREMNSIRLEEARSRL